MEILVKTRQMITTELGYGDVKTLMRHLKRANVVLPKRILLLPQDQKCIYEALFYPKWIKKEWYENY